MDIPADKALVEETLRRAGLRVRVRGALERSEARDQQRSGHRQRPAAEKGSHLLEAGDPAPSFLFSTDRTLSI